MINAEQIDNKTIELEQKPIGQLLLLYALPSVISQVIASVYNIADRIFIGQGVGPLAIAGLAITFPLMNVIHAFGSLVGVGSAARISIVLGKKDLYWAEKILGNSTILTIIMGVLIFGFGYGFMEKILMLFGATQDTIQYALEYMNIVLPGMVLMTVTLNLTGLIRATGYPARCMYILGGGAVLNVILDPIFIFGLHLGIAGAAWATTISMAVTTIVSILHFVSKSSFIRYKLHAWRPKLFIFKNVLMIGLSPFLMNLTAAGVVALLNSQLLKYGGDYAIGAFGIVNSYANFTFLFILGICQGMQPIAGYNYGAGHTDRLKGIYILTTKICVSIGLICSIISLAIPEPLVRVFTKDTELIETSVPAIRFMMAMFPFIAFHITNTNFFQSIDKPWVSIVTSLSRQLLFLLPLCYVVPLIFESMRQPGLYGVWMSCSISDFLGAALAGILLYTQRDVFNNAEHIYKPSDL